HAGARQDRDVEAASIALVPEPGVDLGIKEHVGDRVLGASSDFLSEKTDALLGVGPLGVDRGADAEAGALGFAGARGSAWPGEVLTLIEFFDLLDQLPGVVVTPVARLPVRLAVGRIASQRQDVANPEVMMVHELVFHVMGREIAAGEMRDAGDAEALL